MPESTPLKPPATPQAAPPAQSDPDGVTYRVLPLGCGQIYSGAYDRVANRFTTLTKGERATAPLAVVQALEARGFAEIV